LTQSREQVRYNNYFLYLTDVELMQSPRPIPLHFLTMYADLVQGFEFEDTEVGSIAARQIKGRAYLYLTTKDGATRRQKSLGPADDPQVHDTAKRIVAAAARARIMRTVVATLKQKARIPAPTLQMGKVLEVLANAGLFKRGMTLVGTAAYQTYPCILGFHLPDVSFITNDIDLSVAEFVAGDLDDDLEAILQRAEPSFRPRWHPEDKLPKVFEADSGLRVDMLTKAGRGAASARKVEGLKCAAAALSFQEYLVEDTIETVCLYGRGVQVRVPTPLKYAVHKLIVARRRKVLAKRSKDLTQAGVLLRLLSVIDATALQDEVDDARSRGKAWKSAIDLSLKEIGLAEL
jgi:hypothetical protein